ncbi:MAG: hypothetical protein JNL74_21665, partial [Fibrobacteres bacterium]|nr:hypothetical protein [Fibrobacterota bacterium]
AFRNSSRVTYTNSETLLSGSIVWTRTGGEADPLSPHTSTLFGTELTAGLKNNILLSQAPPLTHGAIYSVVFNGVDRAGNIASAVTVNNVTYIAQPPTITNAAPEPNTYVNNKKVTYTLSTDFSVGQIRWERLGGAADAGSPHIKALVGGELTSGDHNDFVITNVPDLVDGTRYRVQFSGSDMAANAATTITNDNVYYDVTAPVLTMTLPDNNMYVRNTNLSYVISEVLATATITWTRTGGSPDPAAPHTVDLIAAERGTGGVFTRTNYTPANNPSLVDGAIYTVTFTAVDRAGNAAVTVTKTNVTFDAYLPTISATAPAPSTSTPNTKVSYTLSENFSSGNVRWAWSAGVADPASPHTVNLVGAELTAGAHNDITLSSIPPLVDGAYYTVRFAGNDLAGNAAANVSNTNVKYDVTTPVFTVTVPLTSTSVRTANVTYNLSEALASGSITWTRTGGTSDPGSPRTQTLVGTELAAGAHNNIALVNPPTLVDGAIYTVTFAGIDLAGNASVPAPITGVTYDVMIPVISNVAPVPNSYTNSTKVSYTLSEAFSSMNIRWSWSAGAADPLSPQTKVLVGSELASGTHNNITLTNPPTLVNGTRYTVQFWGTDLAGNASAWETNGNVWYDVTAPVITFSAPANSSVQTSAAVSYSLSETFGTATITWTRTGGSPDPNSPHVKSLSAAEMGVAVRTNYIINNSPLLVDGAIYDVTFAGMDLAGNNAVSVTRTGVTYNLAAPTITSTTPIPNAYVNHTRVSYTLSEEFLSGTVRWTRSAGNADANSPHIKALTGTELLSGIHSDITLTNAPTLVDGTRYTVMFSGSDLDGNAAANVSNANIWYDATPPVVTLTLPATNAYRRNAYVSYTISEACASGTIKFTRTGGTADPSSPQTVNLVASELTAGTRTNYMLVNNPVLVDGAIYSVELNVYDLAGNSSIPVTNTNVTYDVTPPLISSVTPINNEMVNHTRVSYTVSEALASGTVTWTRGWGVADPLSPHVKSLTGGELASGVHSDITLTNAPTLNNGSIYNVTVNGTDLAGNAAVAVTKTYITYNVSPPVISATAPVTGAFVNNKRVTYTLSEALSSGTITWTRTGGTADPGSPHVKSLIATERTTGAHTNILLANSPTLIDGAIYTVSFNGVNNVGTAAVEVNNTGITYDVTLPLISSVKPIPNAYVNHTKVSYTLSEECASGTIRWLQTAGNADPASPHVQVLTAGELAAGIHTDIVLSDNPALVDGARYAVYYNVTDKAGNAAIQEASGNVWYDVSAPVFSAVAPTTNSFINSARVSYTLSEQLTAGKITWVRTGGASDPASPRVCDLVSTEITAGVRTNVLLTNAPALVPGAIYSMTFTGTDRSGNDAVAVTETNLNYSVTIPTITGTAPLTGTSVSNTKVSYTLSTDFSQGTVTWTWSAGTADPSSPHIKALTGSELTAGAHNNITLTNNPALVDGAIYTVSFAGRDLANNAAVTISNTNVRYDASVPVLTFTAPNDNAYIRNTNVSYSLPENLASGTITWTRTGGVVDPLSPQVKTLTAGELTAGARANYQITNFPVLMSGSIYSIAINGTDLAGNAALPVTKTNVTYDITSPAFTLTAPATNAVVNSSRVSYTLSENITSGIITWTRTAGAADAGSPHICNLAGTELNAGAHSSIFLADPPVIVNGAIYTVSFTGTDAAGNVATTVSNINVTYNASVLSVDVTGAPTVVNTLAPISLGVSFSTSVAGFVIGDITATNCTKSNFAGSGANYTFDITPTGAGNINVSIPANVAQDVMLNFNASSTPVTILFDNTAPTVSIGGAPAYKNNTTSFSVAATFSENVVGFTAGDISVTNGSVSNLTGAGLLYNFDVTPTGTGNVVISINAAVAQDAAGNNNTAATPVTVIYDATAPTVAITGAPTHKNNTTPFAVTATFNESVTGFTSGDITVANGSVSGFAGAGTTYTFNVTPTGLANVMISINASVALDLAGNNNTAATPVTVIYDATAPNVAITSAAPNPINVPFTATITFNEDMTGFAVGDITVANAILSAFTNTTANRVWTVLVTPTGANVSVNVPAGVATDAATNGNNAAPTPLTRTYDATQPTVVLSSPSSASVNAPFTVTVTFNEDVAGFVVGDITVGNATLSVFTNTTANRVWTVLVTPTGANVTVDVAAGVATDAATNGNTAATQLTRIYDIAQPTVALSSIAPNPLNAPFTVTVTFNEDVTGFDISDITTVNATLSAFTNTTANKVWTVLVSPTDAAVTVDVAAGVAQDLAGNNNTAAVQ